MDNPIIYQALGGLLIVFFLVMIYFFTKTWRWFHIVVVVFLFIAILVYIPWAAATYRTLNAWGTLVTKSTKMVEDLEEKNFALRFGKFDDTEQKEESLRLIRAKISRVILDRGRVWRNCTPGPVANDFTVTVTTSAPGAAVVAAPIAPAPGVVPAVPTPPAGTPPPAGGAAAAAPPAPPAPAGPPANRIQEQTVLFVFREDVPPPELGVPPGPKLPHYYLGDFVAVGVSDTTVTLRPLSPLSQGDVDVLRNLPPSTWTLYETMPVDGHEWFTTDTGRGSAARCLLVTMNTRMPWRG
jgi:hypothetical protein